MSVFKIILLILTIASSIFMVSEILNLIVKIVMRFKLKMDNVVFELTTTDKIIGWVSLTIIISWIFLCDKI